jgi:hypothetical protein
MKNMKYTIGQTVRTARRYATGLEGLHAAELMARY